jgi:hypothetical protein
VNTSLEKKMIRHRKIQFTVSVVMRDVPLFDDMEEVKEDMEIYLTNHLTNYAPLQMIVDNDGKLKITEKENK